MSVSLKNSNSRVFLYSCVGPILRLGLNVSIIIIIMHVLYQLPVCHAATFENGNLQDGQLRISKE